MIKLIQHGIIILIGLSVFLFQGCILTEIDPAEKWYFDIYRNTSSATLTIALKNMSNEEINKITLMSNEENSLIAKDVAFNGGEKPVNEYINDLLDLEFVTIELFIHDGLVKKWTFENVEDNNPYNINSWVVEKPTIQDNGLERGKIIFTITDKDLE